MAAVLTGVLVSVTTDAGVRTAGAQVSQTAPPAPPPEQTPTFRSASDLVTLDVGVRDGRQPVAGLGAADFVVLDNGVRQRVERVDASRVPLDVSLLVDVSGGSPQLWGRPRPPAEVARRTTDLAQKTRGAFRAGDRLRVVAIDTYATEVVPLQPIETPIAIDASGLASNGLSSLFDAIAASLLRPVEPGRRHLVFVVTKATDDISVVDGQLLAAMARRSDAMLHVIVGESMIGNTICMFDCMFPRQRFWRPFLRNAIGILPPIAASTGGSVHEYNGLGLPVSVDREVQNVVAEFRQGYVVQYAPSGVKREGWHTIEVRVADRPSLNVTARSGYAIEPMVAAAAPDARSAGTSTSAVLADLAASFERGDAAAIGRVRPADLSRLIDAVREGEAIWPSRPRMDALFALELAMAGLDHGSSGAQADALRLLEQHARFIRQPLGADGFECHWYWTATARLEGLQRPDAALPFVQNALTRCAGDPRLRLALGMVTDQRWVGSTVGRAGASIAAVPPPAAHTREVLERYEAARGPGAAGEEAAIREAWFLYRTGQVDRALSVLGPVPADSKELRYLHALVRGHILRYLTREDEAAAAYGAALDAWPGAQSARVALMTLHVQQGRREAAADLAAAVETADVLDPWWFYWQGDYRAFPTILGRLRELAR
jgi:VWFA-related protein